jgi:glutathione S-transferase
MVPRLELVSHPLCPYVQRALITLMEKRVKHRQTYIDLANKPQWFREISPLGRVALLRVGNEVLFESAVICEYLDEITPGSLHPADPLAKAVHRSWIEFGSSILDDTAAFYNAKGQEAFDTQRIRIIEKLARLECHIREASYFAGERFALVGAVYGPIFRYFEVFEAIEDFGFFRHTPKASAWRRALGERPSAQEAVAPDYPQRLLAFLRDRNSQLSSRIPAALAV